MNLKKCIGIHALCCLISMGVIFGPLLVSTASAAEPIRHDAEHYVLLHQYAKEQNVPHHDEWVQPLMPLKPIADRR